VCSCARKIHSQKLKVSTQIEWGKLGAVMGKAKGIDVKRELYNQRSAHTHSRNLAKGSPKYLAEFFGFIILPTPCNQNGEETFV